MRLKLAYFLLSFVSFFLFTFFSYTVAKEYWQQIDFDTTVKLQDRIPRIYDETFSYFSFLGSAEITLGIALIMSFLSLIRKKFLAFWGWLVIFPASGFEVLGKLLIFHPAPPVLFHRSIIETHLPSFYIHTNFSYPSGHITRTAFLVTVLILWTLSSKRNYFTKLLLIGIFVGFGAIMAVTRVYLGEHWLSDVLGGGLLGSAAGFLAFVLIIPKKVGNMTVAALGR